MGIHSSSYKYNTTTKLTTEPTTATTMAINKNKNMNKNFSAAAAVNTNINALKQQQIIRLIVNRTPSSLTFPWADNNYYQTTDNISTPTTVTTISRSNGNSCSRRSYGYDDDDNTSQTSSVDEMTILWTNSATTDDADDYFDIESRFDSMYIEEDLEDEIEIEDGMDKYCGSGGSSSSSSSSSNCNTTRQLRLRSPQDLLFQCFTSERAKILLQNCNNLCIYE